MLKAPIPYIRTPPPQNIWTPLKGRPESGASSQFYAFTCPYDRVLLHGTRGGGKTAVSLMMYAKGLNRGWGTYWKGLYWDKYHKSLSDVVAQSMRYFPKLGGRFLKSPSEYKWVFPQGEELLFRHFAKEQDYWDNAHGQEFPIIIVNELTKHATDTVFKLICSTNRDSFNPEEDTPQLVNRHGEPIRDQFGNVLYATPDGRIAPPIKKQIIATTNSSGAGRLWVKRDFIDVAPYGVPVETKQTVEGRVTIKTQVSIFSCWAENLKANGGFLDDSYIAELKELTRGNKNLKKSWIEGSWDISSGAAFESWDGKVHILPRFKIPENWRIFRSFDWGSSAPFSVGWFAEANGESVILPNGKKFTPPRGTLIQFYEWYGCEAIGTNKGLKDERGFPIGSRQVARGIKKIEEDLLSGGWILKKITEGVADGSIFDNKDSAVPTTGKIMKDEGVSWKEANKDNGSRIHGIEVMRDRLENSLAGELEGFYVMQNCKASIEILPNLPLDDKNIDDIDSACEDHIWDMCRYALLHVSRVIKKVTVKGLY